MPSAHRSRLVRRITEVAVAVFVTAVVGILFGYLNRPQPPSALPAPTQARETPVDEYGMRFVRTEPAQPAEPARKEAEPQEAPAAAARKPAAKQPQPTPVRRTANASEKLQEPIALTPPAAPPTALPPPVQPAAVEPSGQSNVLAALRRIPGWFLPSSSSAPAAASPPPAEAPAAEYPPRPPRPVGPFVQGTM